MAKSSHELALALARGIGCVLLGRPLPPLHKVLGRREHGRDAIAAGCGVDQSARRADRCSGHGADAGDDGANGRASSRTGRCPSSRAHEADARGRGPPSTIKQSERWVGDCVDKRIAANVGDELNDVAADVSDPRLGGEQHGEVGHGARLRPDVLRHDAHGPLIHLGGQHGLHVLVRCCLDLLAVTV